MTCSFPGYEHVCFELGTLLSMHPPPFIYIQDIESVMTTFSVIGTLLRALSDESYSSISTGGVKICHARVDAIACFNARLFYEAVINSLVQFEPSWEDGCGNWESDVEMKWNENMDAFLHGLRAAHADLCSKNHKGKGKGKERAGGGYEHVRLVIVVERAERLKESLPELLVPLTRLAELARLDLSVIFISQVGWEDIRPPLGASPDPYYIDIQSPSKENIVRGLVANFEAISDAQSSYNPYHPALKPLYAHFIAILCDVCFPFTHSPQELQYIAAARWPGFVKPVLDDHLQTRDKALDEEDVDMEDDSAHTSKGELVPPTEEVRMRLNKLFNASLSTAFEALLPRLTNAADWARANEPPGELLSFPRTFMLEQAKSASKAGDDKEEGIRALPRLSKFILLAAFLASTNPPKSDLRMFGRGLDEKKRKRRVVTKSAGKGGVAKVSQRLLGPTPFALDRLIAILGALLEENDVQPDRSLSKILTIPGEYTDMEITRVSVYSNIMELTAMRLLHRTSPPERLDGPPMFRCAVSYDTALGIAKQLDVALNDLLWDPV
ncbi:hypothetical protein M413DRAFT_443679 [Hebeloma cylindrosporum]|uniref:Origin recognition complex subunit 5 n=1 Tax=Hebeloma cylindrosporum TaxID=76867 RepID=A0A0C2Y1P9_HEBCY|nr:hypothetical protein M413DRAFT_443679 [Hebeloma cylindrosporum h7]